MIFIDREPLSASKDVADYLGLTTATVSTLVDDLVERKLVLRAASEVDRRTNFFPSGAAALEKES